MIKANELRIGNLLSWIDDNEIVKVKGFYITNTIWVEYNYNENETDEIDCQLECLKPIPLTEEWLLKFGFEKVVSEYVNICLTHYQNKDCWIYIFDDSSFEIELITGDERHNLYRRYHHVHQLQNLYFALTGEELELKTQTA